MFTALEKMPGWLLTASKPFHGSPRSRRSTTRQNVGSTLRYSTPRGVLGWSRRTGDDDAAPRVPGAWTAPWAHRGDHPDPVGSADVHLSDPQTEGVSANGVAQLGQLGPLDQHVLVGRAAGGVRERNGHTEAAVDLMRAAGLRPVAAISEIVADDGEMMRWPGLVALGARDGVPVVSIAELVVWLDEHDRQD